MLLNLEHFTLFFGGETSNKYLWHHPRVMEIQFNLATSSNPTPEDYFAVRLPPGVRGHWVPPASRQFLLHKDAQPTRSPWVIWSGDTWVKSRDTYRKSIFSFILQYNIYTMKFPWNFPNLNSLAKKLVHQQSNLNSFSTTFECQNPFASGVCEQLKFEWIGSLFLPSNWNQPVVNALIFWPA